MVVVGVTVVVVTVSIGVVVVDCKVVVVDVVGAVVAKDVVEEEEAEDVVVGTELAELADVVDEVALEVDVAPDEDEELLVVLVVGTPVSRGPSGVRVLPTRPA